MIQGRRSYTVSNVRVGRDDNGMVEISWQAVTEVFSLGLSIYVGDSPDAIDRKSPAAMVKGLTRAKIPGLAPYVRRYFELVADGGPGVIALSAQVV